MKRILFIGLVLTAILFACQEKAADKNDLKAFNSDGNTEVECLEMVYPLTYIMPDGSTIIVNIKEEMRAVRMWYKENPGYKEKPILQFPVDVIFKGELKTIKNQGEMKKIREMCKKDRKPCYEFIYPITYVMPDGSTITGNNRKELMAVRMWYKEHPGVTEKPALQYPVEVIFKGETLTIDNDEQMQRIKKACKKDGKTCFVMVFPVTYTMPDGTEITIEKKEDRKLIRSWYEANPGNKEKPILQYPVDIKYKDGTMATINNKQEMRRAKAECE